MIEAMSVYKHFYKTKAARKEMHKNDYFKKLIIFYKYALWSNKDYVILQPFWYLTFFM